MTEDELRLELGRRLRARRSAQDRTLASVALGAGLSVPYVANLENGRGNPTLGSLHSLAQALDVPLAELVREASAAAAGRPAPAPLPAIPAGPRPRTGRGWRTRGKLLDAAESIFGTRGFHASSIADITRAAGVALGTFYVYFPSKEAIFVELVKDMGHDMRRRLHDASAAAPDRLAAEEAGFRAFFDFVAQHPNLYRIVRECEFVAPGEYRAWYERLAERYRAGLVQAMDAGEFRRLDPELIAYCLMGMGDFLGMRLVLWDRRRRVPRKALATVMEMLLDGLRGRRDH
jgi:AcrR family transcriptional regulator